MKKFLEKNFVAHFKELVDNDEFDTALHYYLNHVAELTGSGIHVKEKINHLLYLPRLLHTGIKMKHGYHKLLAKTRRVQKMIQGYELPPGGFVEFGCGVHDPIALATLHHLNGFSPCHAIDLKKPRNEIYSALSMYDILSNIRCFPDRYCFLDRNLASFLDRLTRLDFSAFESGDFWGGLKGIKFDVNYELCDIAESTIEDGSIALLVSFAVLEHVDELDSVCRKLSRVVKRGGMCFHFIDLMDHRSYGGNKKFNAFSFLTEDTCPRGVNRLRAFEITQVHERHGFEILKDRRRSEPIPEEIKRCLLPRYRRMRIEDVSVTKQVLLVRKT